MSIKTVPLVPIVFLIALVWFEFVYQRAEIVQTLCKNAKAMQQLCTHYATNATTVQTCANFPGLLGPWLAMLASHTLCEDSQAVQEGHKQGSKQRQGRTRTHGA